MKRHTVSIPSSFVHLDSTVTTDNEFVNVRDQQVLRSNHNLLIARRIQHTIFSIGFVGTIIDSVVRPYTSYLTNHMTVKTRQGTEEIGAPILRAQIYVQRCTKQLRLKVRACKSLIATEGSELDFSPIVLASAWNGYAQPVIAPSAAATISAAHGSPATYSMDISLPPVTADDNMHNGKQMFEFGVWVRCAIDHTIAEVSSSVIGSATYNSFDSTVAPGKEHMSMHFDTETGIEQRMIVKTTDLGSGWYRTFVDKPFSSIPDPNSDTFVVHDIQGIDIYDATLRSLPLTDFQLEQAL